MEAQARVVVIGGGVVGCSVLYHLAKMGWSDVVLLERDELTSGSTWHAAGGMHTINGDPNVAKLQKYTIDLYKEIAELSGQDIGLHLTGGVMLAASQSRLDWLKSLAAKGSYLGIETEIISPEAAHAAMPLLDPSKFVGAMRSYVDGHLDPSGVTHAYAKAARKLGARIERFTKVEDLAQNRDGSWRVITNKGEIRAEHVVNAGGLWAREVGRMVGLELPLLAMEHMYLLTEDMPEVADWKAKTGGEMIHAVDFDGELYLRQERGGMLMGTYEQACKPWSPKSTPWDFGHELLEPDIDRIAPSLEIGFEHFPAFKDAGIKQIINGPFTFAPDGNPLVGPVQGLENFWCACAVMAGFSQGGGVGLALANWMVEGDPGMDIWAMDVARYGEWASLRYTNAKVQENYKRRFSIRFPNEELPAARPHMTTPLYDIQVHENNAVMGDSWGLETPLWYAPKGSEARDVVSFHRSTDFEHVGNEVRAVRNSVGVTEISNFAKYEISGEGAQSWLSQMMTNNMPKNGRVVLTPMLNDNGKLIGDFTIAKTGDNKFMMWGSSAAQIYHMRWFERHLPDDQSVRVHRFGQTLSGLSIAGPNARKLLAKLCDEDVSNEAFRFMDFREMAVAGVPCKVNRLTYTGDLGYEIWLEPAYLRTLYLAIKQAGAEFDIADFGMRALLSMRLEKNFPTWFSELRPIYGPYEASMERFVKLSKNDFIGREAAAREHNIGPKLRRVTFTIDAIDTDVIADEPVWAKLDEAEIGAEGYRRDGDWVVVGWVTSGGYGHFVEASLAQAYIPARLQDRFEEGLFEIEIQGDRRSATLVAEPLFDPTGARMRN